MEELAGNAVIARPHFAQVMVRHGYVSTNREDFDRYLDTDEYQKIERFKVSARDCIAAIRSDGGRAALAHPYQLGLDDERLYSSSLSATVRAPSKFQTHSASNAPEKMAAFAGESASVRSASFCSF